MSRKKNFFIKSVFYAILFWLLSAVPIYLWAAEESKIVIIIKSQAIPPYEQAMQGILGALRDQGFQEGKNIELISYEFEDDPAFMAKVRENHPDIVITVGTEATQLVQKNFPTFPAVFSMVLSPSRYQFVDKQGQPIAKMTGVSMDISVEDQFKAIRLAVPQIKRIGVMYNPANSTELINEAQRAALDLGFELYSIPVERSSDVPKKLRDMVGKIDILWMGLDKTVLTKDSITYILTFTLENRIPCLGYNRDSVKSGALLGLHCDYADIGRQSGDLASQILRGVDPQSLSSVAPRKPLIILNLKTAKWLDISISKSVVDAASEIIN